MSLDTRVEDWSGDPDDTPVKQQTESADKIIREQTYTFYRVPTKITPQFFEILRSFLPKNKKLFISTTLKVLKPLVKLQNSCSECGWIGHTKDEYHKRSREIHYGTLFGDAVNRFYREYWTNQAPENASIAQHLWENLLFLIKEDIQQMSSRGECRITNPFGAEYSDFVDYMEHHQPTKWLRDRNGNPTTIDYFIILYHDVLLRLTRTKTDKFTILEVHDIEHGDSLPDNYPKSKRDSKDRRRKVYTSRFDKKDGTPWTSVRFNERPPQSDLIDYEFKESVLEQRVDPQNHNPVFHFPFIHPDDVAYNSESILRITVWSVMNDESPILRAVDTDFVQACVDILERNKLDGITLRHLEAIVYSGSCDETSDDIEYLNEISRTNELGVVFEDKAEYRHVTWKSLWTFEWTLSFKKCKVCHIPDHNKVGCTHHHVDKLRNIPAKLEEKIEKGYCLNAYYLGSHKSDFLVGFYIARIKWLRLQKLKERARSTAVDSEMRKSLRKEIRYLSSDLEITTNRHVPDGYKSDHPTEYFHALYIGYRDVCKKLCDSLHIDFKWTDGPISFAWLAPVDTKELDGAFDFSSSAIIHGLGNNSFSSFYSNLSCFRGMASSNRAHLSAFCRSIATSSTTTMNSVLSSLHPQRTLASLMLSAGGSAQGGDASLRCTEDLRSLNLLLLVSTLYLLL